jgi:hypothetical protein
MYLYLDNIDNLDLENELTESIISDTIKKMYEKFTKAIADVQAKVKSTYDKFKKRLREFVDSEFRIHPSHVEYGKLLKNIDNKMMDLVRKLQKVKNLDDMNRLLDAWNKISDEYLQSLEKIGESIEATKNDDYRGFVIVKDLYTVDKLILALANDIDDMGEKFDYVTEKIKVEFLNIVKTLKSKKDRKRYDDLVQKFSAAHSRFMKAYTTSFDKYYKGYINQVFT